MPPQAAPLLVFDDGSNTLGPLTRRLARFELITGGCTTLERIERVLGRTADALLVPPAIEAGVYRRTRRPTNPRLDADRLLAVHGGWHALEHADKVASLQNDEALVQPTGAVVAANLPAADAERLAKGGALPAHVSKQTLREPVLFERPWDVVRFLPRTLPADLEPCDFPQLPQGHVAGLSVIGEHPVRLHPSAQVVPPATFDATRGPIVIDQGAELRPFVAIQGPVYVGRRTSLASFASLRPNTAIGPECRVGGEVSHSVIQAYSNKAHAGYLGNACVGQWCNLGAQTTVSNLKNTYGPIRIQLEPHDEPIDTGLTHQGPILGDMVRTAIGTRIPTGACIDLASSLAVSTFAPKYTPPFTWATDAGAETYDLERLLRATRLAMARRGDELDDDETQLLTRLHHQLTHPQSPS